MTKTLEVVGTYVKGRPSPRGHGYYYFPVRNGETSNEYVWASHKTTDDCSKDHPLDLIPLGSEFVIALVIPVPSYETWDMSQELLSPVLTFTEKRILRHMF